MQTGSETLGYRLVLCTLLLLAGAAAKAGAAPRPPSLARATSANAYLYNDGIKSAAAGGCTSLVSETGTLCPSASKPVALTQKQVKKLVELLRDRKGTMEGAMACWEPHHGIEVLDAAGKRIGVVDICFECHRIETPWLNEVTLTGRGLRSWRSLLFEIGLTKHLPASDVQGMDEEDDTAP